MCDLDASSWFFIHLQITYTTAHHQPHHARFTLINGTVAAIVVHHHAPWSRVAEERAVVGGERRERGLRRVSNGKETGRGERGCGTRALKEDTGGVVEKCRGVSGKRGKQERVLGWSFHGESR